MGTSSIGGKSFIELCNSKKVWFTYFQYDNHFNKLTISCKMESYDALVHRVFLWKALKINSLGIVLLYQALTDRA